MPNLPTTIEIPVYSSDSKLKFTTTEDVHRWLEAEEPFWEKLYQNITNTNLKNLFSHQVNFFSNVRNFLRQLENVLSNNQQSNFNQFNQYLANSLNPLGGGKVLTSKTSLYPAIVEIEKIDPNSACLLYLAAREDANQLLGSFGKNIQTKVLLEFVLNYPLIKKSKDWLAPQRHELASLRDDYLTDLQRLRNMFSEQNDAIETQQREADQEHSDRVVKWNDFIQEKNLDWEKLKKVYNEQLALEAPTKYWKTRAKWHTINAFVFAILFLSVLAASIDTFLKFGMPYLADRSPDSTATLISTLIPIVVPAFIFIWILKILSRLLSENIGLMRDARERKTMVETFLALMQDDAKGKPLIKDDDRILILHSLFRPSSITATDDAPPVHWFDVLTNKFGSKDSK
jgi:hypothetical protein